MKHRPGCPCDTCAPLRRNCDVQGCTNAATHVPQLTIGDDKGRRLAMPPATIALLLCRDHLDKTGARAFAKTIPVLSESTILAVKFVSLDHRVARQLARVKGATS